ncbi:response regulator [Desulfoluna spongiiphila]|uniref:CBS domain-containing protein n=1 Tax=Desulfoluna spongiiphila TaxID=419481 RepID=A0A1G5IV77_9BACT|nr:response regulator [Desulfoluna spongiiphila]SCY79611.1 CBS domain-containing protein [Desulfoluna spongiiphila]VVS93363.1 signal transduction response regulator receiver domain [Desulfoluna spongiiphila]
MSIKIRVMIVDDEERFRVATQKVLERRGFEVITAESGEEALERLDKAPQVVVLDIRMAGMDGLTALGLIKARKPKIPVIMLTGHGTGESAEEALAAGAYDFLAKPCDIDLLATKIYEAGHVPGTDSEMEKTVGEVMIPLAEYETARPNQTLGYAVRALRASFSPRTLSGSLIESGQRSLLVLSDGEVKGVLSVRGLMEALLPAYIHADLPSTASTIRYSPMFWKGLFTSETKKLMDRKVSDVMTEAPPEVDIEANLMEAAYLMVSLRQRRLAVMAWGQCQGIIREEELFFEIERIASEG